MAIEMRLRSKLIVLSLASGLIPLIIAILYLGSSSVDVLEEQAGDYLKSRVEGFARIAEIRNTSISGNLDIIREQLKKGLKKDLIDEAKNERYYETGYLAIFSSDGTCVYHPKAEFMGNMSAYNSHDYVRNAVHQKQGLFKYSAEGESMWGYLAYNKDLDWIMWASAAEDEILAKINAVKMQMYGFLVIISILIGIAGWLVAHRIASVANEISDKMKDIAQGEADLSARLPVLSKDEVGDIAHWFNEFVAKLEEVILSVKLAAAQVDTATQEVASGSQGLSQATQEQASAIEEVAATIEQMTSSIKQNASNAAQGREKALSMVQMASQSGEASQELVNGMSEISEASRKIGDIIVTVNEVAFQTNLLALNAAVEAARAGEHGKGFAVVAEEVRALAQRSAEAARQIKSLIEDTVNKINAGDEMVKRSGESLNQIIDHIQDLSQTMEEIAAASSEQASGVDELNRAVSQIDNTTQQNSATVEELASTSDHLSNEAKELARIVGRFRVSGIDYAQQRMIGKPASLPAEQKQGRSMTPSYQDDFEEF
ncbi:MAG TPA: methyl-accepting chemotaxis protein [Desulfomonilia bacterium]|nr:methyl-accepting chemotaxis protein [Deltaproteobacteria bacterium]HPD22013.1 methyl-accepting chemotaxis protein [Deltaproteobacteria bacterium]HRS56848.1 methyl-accepting chemotaxis protein [Desulfomonilia bacterium]HRV36537.1 methyl-accepting chemotaxis protein [Desulfomonilia bacterium]